MPFARLCLLLPTVSLVALACGSTTRLPLAKDGATDQAVATAGSGGSSGSGAAMDGGLAVVGSGGASNCAALVLAPAGDAGPACPQNFAQNGNCGESYVDIVGDGEPIRLAYPMDSSCGSCGATGCDIWGVDAICCGPGILTLAACAGPNGAGPCLAARSCTRYIDRAGKTWLATIVPDSPKTEQSPLDVQATATITDGTTTRSLSLHIHICGSTIYCLIPC